MKGIRFWKVFALLAILTALTVVCFAASAEIVDSGTCGKNGNNLTWTLEDDGKLTISGTGEMADYTYDSGSPWGNGIKSIEIRAGVTNIGNYAFKSCSNLTSITIPDSVTSIGGFAFNICTSLTSIIFPDNVTSIGECAFIGCDNLRTINLPDNITTIYSNSFYLPSINTIGVNSFNTTAKTLSKAGFSFLVKGMKYSLKYLYNGNTEIGLEITKADSDITEVSFIDGVTSIGNYAFSNCFSLKIVIIPDGVTNIGDLALTGLTSITVPNSVTSIGNNAISSETIIYCEKDSFVDKWAVTNGNCRIYPDGSKSDPIIISNGTCGANGDNLTWTLNNEGLLIISGTGEMDDYDYGTNPWRARAETIDIQEGVTSIGDGAFNYCNRLTTITLPSSLTSIGKDAFLWCQNLKSITIPDTVSSIGASAFTGCMKMASTKLPKYLTSIEDHVFDMCDSLTVIVIPDSVSSIGNHAFDLCQNLETVSIPEKVTSIGDCAFDECISLTAITIQGYNTSIGKNAIPATTTIHCYKDSVAEKWARDNNCLNIEYIECSEGEHILVDDEAVPATCTQTGLTAGKHCSVCGKVLVTQEIIAIDPDNHVWGNPTWSWSGVESATATWVCGNDPTHTHVEQATIASEVTTAATCESAGAMQYTASISFGNQIYTDTMTGEITTLGHAWDGGVVTTATTCEAAGVKTFTCTRCGGTKTEAIPATGHNYSAPTYAWAEDNSSVTAEMICVNNATHKVTETVSTTSQKTKAPTETERGETTYTATFTNPAFIVQQKVVDDIPVLTPPAAPEETDVGVKTGDNVPEMKVEAVSEAVVQSLTTPEEQSRLDIGETLLVYMDVENIDATVSDADKQQVIAASLKQDSDAKVGMYLDMSLYKQIGNDEPTKVTDLNGNKIKFSVAIPENLQKENRVFYIVRVHDGIAEIIATGAGNSIEGESDKFSTYALIYVDEADQQTEPTPTPEPENYFHMSKDATKKVKVKDTIQIIVDGYKVKKYETDNKKVATVTDKGLVKAVGAGTAKITITTTKKIKKQYKTLVLTVKVTDPNAPKSVKIKEGKKATLKVGGKLQLTAVLKPEKAKTRLTWTSSDKKIATVSSKGLVKAKKPGEVKITVTTGNGKSATIRITVKKKSKPS